MTLPTIEQLEAMLANTTPGPWRVVEYDSGDKDHWDNCPSIQAAPEYDCAIVHWDGFKQKYWMSARGQSEINGNAALIALTPTLAVQRIADAKRIAELEAAQVTVQEAARVLLGVFEDPEANAPQRFDWQSMYQEMTRDHNESMEICGTHDWPQTLVVALRAIAGHP